MNYVNYNSNYQYNCPQRWIIPEAQRRHQYPVAAAYRTYAYPQTNYQLPQQPQQPFCAQQFYDRAQQGYDRARQAYYNYYPQQQRVYTNNNTQVYSQPRPVSFVNLRPANIYQCRPDHGKIDQSEFMEDGSARGFSPKRSYRPPTPPPPHNSWDLDSQRCLELEDRILKLRLEVFTKDQALQRYQANEQRMLQQVDSMDADYTTIVLQRDSIIQRLEEEHQTLQHLADRMINQISVKHHEQMQQYIAQREAYELKIYRDFDRYLQAIRIFVNQKQNDLFTKDSFNEFVQSCQNLFNYEYMKKDVLSLHDWFFNRLNEYKTMENNTQLNQQRESV